MSSATPDTTGQIVAQYTNPGISICIDKGWYPGTQLYQNVRKLETLHTLDAVSTAKADAIIKESADQRYGCGWGAGSVLFPITDEQVAKLVELEAQAKADAEAKEAELDAAEAAEFRTARGLTLNEDMACEDSSY